MNSLDKYYEEPYQLKGVQEQLQKEVEKVQYIPEDSIVNDVIEQYKIRSKNGIKEYGTSLDRTDFSLLQWLNELQSELMDATLYIEKLKKELK